MSPTKVFLGVDFARRGAEFACVILIIIRTATILPVMIVPPRIVIKSNCHKCLLQLLAHACICINSSEHSTTQHINTPMGIDFEKDPHFYQHQIILKISFLPKRLSGECDFSDAKLTPLVLARFW